MVLKQSELLESPEVDDQQPSIPLTKYEGSKTNSWNFMKKECVECFWYNTYYCTEISKTKNILECMLNSAMNKAINEYINKEYNTDTSALPISNNSDDIV